jgi:hypothetical protein
MIGLLLLLMLAPRPAHACSSVDWNRLLQGIPACDTDTIFKSGFDPLPWLGF